MHEYLVQNGITLKAENEPFNMEKGDIIIWGKQGQSAGANGHTGICIDNQNWSECTAWHDLGETIQNHDKRWVMAGKPILYVYSYTGRTPGTNPNVTYGLHVKGGDWLSPVVNFNPVNSDGYAGLPNHEHDMFYARVDHGVLKYRVHKIEAGWLDWVMNGNPNDSVNGCAGMVGQTIDGVQMVYNIIEMPIIVHKRLNEQIGYQKSRMIWTLQEFFSLLTNNKGMVILNLI